MLVVEATHTQHTHKLQKKKQHKQNHAQTKKENLGFSFLKHKFPNAYKCSRGVNNYIYKVLNKCKVW